MAQSTVRVLQTIEHRCGYYPDRAARNLVIDPTVDRREVIYDALTAAGFRRAGDLIFRPHCRNCTACHATRVTVGKFRPNRSQKRCWSRNQDLTIRVSDTGRKFNCANIAPKGFCSNRFKQRRYEYQPIEIEWTFDGRTRKTESFVVDVSPNLYLGRALRGVIKIRPGGEISAGFVEFRPNRGQDSDRD